MCISIRKREGHTFAFIKVRNMNETEKEKKEKPTMFLRRGRKGGLYFFSPQKTVIYYMAGNHVRDLLDGKRDFAVIHKGERLNND